MIKKYVLSISLILFFAAVFGFLYFKKAKAGSADNVYGWAWSENIGWISFNSTNCDNSPEDGVTDNAKYSQCPVGMIISDYGVNVDFTSGPNSGKLSGYAWSENIGWIDFAPLGPYPLSPNYSACLDLPGSGQVCDGVGDYKLSGWVRALAASSAQSGDWDGWLKLSGPGYGVSLSTTTEEMEKWSWGGDDTSTEAVIGWISFNCKDRNYCPTVDYKVETEISLPPDVPSGLSTDQNSCAWGTIPQAADGFSVTFEWDYAGVNPQAAYEIWVDDNSSFTSVNKFNNLVLGSGTSYVLKPADDDDSNWISKLSWSTTYYWKVRVRDTKNNMSSWSDYQSFATPAHAAPDVNFTPFPESPPAKSVVTLRQDSLSSRPSYCYDAAGTRYYCQARNTTYSWIFQNGNPSSLSSNKNVTTTWAAKGLYAATLSIQDNTLSPPIICSTSTNINVQLALPWWKEVSPLQ